MVRAASSTGPWRFFPSLLFREPAAAQTLIALARRVRRTTLPASDLGPPPPAHGRRSSAAPAGSQSSRPSIPTEVSWLWSHPFSWAAARRPVSVPPRVVRRALRPTMMRRAPPVVSSSVVQEGRGRLRPIATGSASPARPGYPSPASSCLMVTALLLVAREDARLEPRGAAPAASSSEALYILGSLAPRPPCEDAAGRMSP